MASVDPDTLQRIRELDQAEYESFPDDRIRELEEQFEALREHINSEEDSFDDDQLSRLGINNFVRDDTNTINTGIDNNHGFWRRTNGIGDNVQLDVQGSCNYNGIELERLIQDRIDVEVAPLETRITELENEVRSLREENGQDNS